MEYINRIDINLLYASDNGEVNFADILKYMHFIDPEDSTLDSFSCAQGGMELKADRIFTFYRSINFSDHFSAVFFLFESLVYLCKMETNIFRKESIEMVNSIINDIADKKAVILKHSNNAQLQLVKNSNDNHCKLSYTNPNSPITEEKNDPYFINLTIDTERWVKAAIVGLEEYFNFLCKSMNITDSTETSALLVRFFNLWVDIKGGLGINAL